MRTAEEFRPHLHSHGRCYGGRADDVRQRGKGEIAELGPQSPAGEFLIFLNLVDYGHNPISHATVQNLE